MCQLQSCIQKFNLCTEKSHFGENKLDKSMTKTIVGQLIDVLQNTNEKMNFHEYIAVSYNLAGLLKCGVVHHYHSRQPFFLKLADLAKLATLIHKHQCSAPINFPIDENDQKTAFQLNMLQKTSFIFNSTMINNHFYSSMGVKNYWHKIKNPEGYQAYKDYENRLAIYALYADFLHPIDKDVFYTNGVVNNDLGCKASDNIQFQQELLDVLIDVANFWDSAELKNISLSSNYFNYIVVCIANNIESHLIFERYSDEDKEAHSLITRLRNNVNLTWFTREMWSGDLFQNETEKIKNSVYSVLSHRMKWYDGDLNKALNNLKI